LRAIGTDLRSGREEAGPAQQTSLDGPPLDSSFRLAPLEFRWAELLDMRPARPDAPDDVSQR